jgi:manganese/zinc/iron transport system substrate-binding protein
MKTSNTEKTGLSFFVTSRLVALRGLGTIFTVLFFAGCDSGDSDGTLVVVSTTTHVTDMVKFVAGDRLEVIALMGPGVDPHLYKPSAGDAATLAKADLILYNGLMLEGRMADVFAKVSRRGTKTYAVTETVSEELLLEPKEFEGHWDPHVWFDPEIWSECIEVVRDALSENDPAGKAGYAERAETLKTQYLAVTHWAQSRISELPEESRYLVTSHDAFNYFGRAFGMKVLAVQGVSTATEAGLADRVAMVDFVKEHGVKAIFVESSVNPAIIKGIAKEAGVRIGGELFSDAMGQPGRLEQGPDGEQYDIGTWVGMMKHNVNAIVEGLK